MHLPIVRLRGECSGMTQPRWDAACFI